MKRGVRALCIIVCLPLVLLCLLIFLWVGWEIMGGIVNSAATKLQTEKLEARLSAMELEVIEGYSFTGNMGNGNHVDMLSVVIFRASDIEEVKRKLEEEYSCVTDIMSVEEDRLKGFLYYMGKAELPENKADCYAAVWVDNAPFADNIAGH